MKHAGRAVLVGIPLAFLGLFFVFPVFTLLWRGLVDDPGAVLNVFGNGFQRHVIWFTVWQAALSTIATLAIALPLTVAIGRYQFRGRRVITALVTIPFVLPTVVVAGAFIALMERLDLSALDETVWIIVLAHAFFNVAVVVRSVGGYWRQLDDRPEQAARVLGAGPLRAFIEVTLPRLRPAVVAAAVIVFLFSFTSFAVILILGGPLRATLETEIYRYAVTRADVSTAAALAVVQLAAVVGLVALSGHLERRIARENLGRSQPRPPATWVLPAALATTGAFLAAPILILVERSFATGDGYGLDHYRALASRPDMLPIDALATVTNSVQFALVATLLALAVGIAAAIAATRRGTWGSLLDGGLMLPLGTSAVTLGLGILISLDEGIVDLRSSWWIIPIAQSLIGIPFIVRSVVPVLRGIDDRTRQAAATLGATPRRVRREIDFPIASRALGVGAAFAFAISLGEFGATSFVGRRPDHMTVPLAISRLLSQPGDQLRGQAMALGVVLMLVTSIVVVGMDRLGDGSDRALL